MSDEALATETYGRVARRLIPFLILCYFSAYIDRSNIGIAKLQFSADLHISEAAYGLAGGLFYLGYCLFEVPSNLLLRRIGARRTFFRILLLWSAFSAALAVVTAPSGFYLLRFLIGAAEAGFFPGVLFYLSQWVPANRRARFTALFMSAMAISGVIGGPFSALILSRLQGIGGLAGWQWLFIVEGLPGIALGFIALAWLPDTPDDARWLSAEQKALIRTELARGKTASASTSLSLAGVLRDPRFYPLAAMAVALIGGIGGIALWMPTVLRASGFTSAARVAALTAVPYFCALVAQQWVARRSDRCGERRWHAGICTLIAAAGWLSLSAATGQPWLTLALLCVTTAAIFGATGPFWTLPSTLFPGPSAAVAIAAVSTCGGIAAFVGPIVVGWLAVRWTTTLASSVFYGVLLAAGGALLLLRTRPQRDNIET
jgi:MFS family permease